MDVVFPLAIREEGATYIVDQVRRNSSTLITDPCEQIHDTMVNGQRVYRPLGDIKCIASATPAAAKKKSRTSRGAK